VVSRFKSSKRLVRHECRSILKGAPAFHSSPSQIHLARSKLCEQHRSVLVLMERFQSMGIRQLHHSMALSKIPCLVFIVVCKSQALDDPVLDCPRDLELL